MVKNINSDRGVVMSHDNAVVTSQKSDFRSQVIDDVSDEDEDVPLFAQKTYKELCCTFAENNSFHGIPFIKRASHWYSRLLWLLAFVFFMTAWIYHSYYLAAVYFKYETSPTLNINYETLEYPSVTICNVNPIRTSLLSYYGSPELVQFLEAIQPPADYETVHPNDRAQVQGEGQNGNGQSQQQQPGQLPAQQRRKRQAGEDTGGSRDKEEEPVQLEVPENEAFGVGNTSRLLVNNEIFKKLYTSLPQSNRTAMGHQKDTFVLSCSFNGKDCSVDDFELVENSDYGNCYMFNSVLNRSLPLRSARSGYTYGLDLILYLEHNEYLEGMSYGHGVRMYVHPFKTAADVAQNGMSLSSGEQTLIGITMQNISRLGGKFGICGDNGTYQEYYGLKYTQQACTRTCLDRTVAHACSCVRMDHFENYNQDDLDNLSSCWDDEDSSICATNLEILNDLNDVGCGCEPPCKNTDYTYRRTQSVWPDDSYWFTLVDYVCGVNDDQCTYLRDTGTSIMSSNFLNLKLYYRDLNYKEYEQKALYEDAQFISDFGGCIGLWIGASAITVVEIIDFAFKCCHFSMWRNKEQAKHREKLRATRFQETADDKSVSGSQRNA